MTALNLYIIILVSGCILQLSFITCDSHHYMRSALLLKSLAAICFFGCGVMAYLSMPSYNGNPAFPTLICCGLAAGAIGDIGLGIRHVLKKGTIPYHISFLIGIVCFLGGHVCYLSALVISVANWHIYIPIAIVCACVFLYFFYKILTAKKIYKILGVFYVSILFSFVACAIGKVVECVMSGMLLDTAPGMGYFLIAIGSIVFSVSDVLTVLNAFGPKKHPTMRLFSLTLYYAAQICIASSFLFLN